MSFSRTRTSGFTLVEIMVVVALIGLLSAIMIPNMARARERSQLTAVQSNLRIIEYAKDQWAIENKKGTGDIVPDLNTLSGYIKYGGIRAVVGETYSPNPIGEAPTALAPVKLLWADPMTPIIAPPY